jgi:Holliday junction resolvasome RuvABC endonuclease subunit
MQITGPILALDLATRTGFAWGVPGRTPESGSVILKKPGDGQDIAFGNMIAWMNERLSSLQPQLVFKESMWSLQASTVRGNSEAAVRLAAGLHAIVEGMCIRYGVAWDERGASTIRKHFIGRGNAGKRDDTKAAVIDRCRLLKLMSPNDEDDNRADALAAHDYACAIFGRRSVSTRELHFFGETA